MLPVCWSEVSVITIDPYSASSRDMALGKPDVNRSIAPHKPGTFSSAEPNPAAVETV
jgi:hypothetical protein